MSYFSMSMVALMTFLTVIDVIGRYLSKWFAWASPVTGTPELTKLMMVITVFFGLSWCAVSNKHLKVDILMNRFSRKVQVVVDTICPEPTTMLVLGLTAPFILKRSNRR